jgi:hypothetical protein
MGVGSDSCLPCSFRPPRTTPAYNRRTYEQLQWRHAAMPNKHYSVAQRLAGAVIARLKGTEAAAAELNMDRRTIRRWLQAAPDDGWTLARDLAQARLQEALATGKVAPSQLATIAGIADRNVRYGELLRQREQRKAAEGAPTEDDAVHQAVELLPDELQVWLRDYLDALELCDAIRAHVGLPAVETEGEEPPAADWLASLQESTAEQRAEVTAELHAQIAELTAGWKVIREGRKGYAVQYVIDAPGSRYAVRGNVLEPALAHLPVIDEAPPLPARDVTPRPALEPVEPEPIPAWPPPVELLPAGQDLEPHPTWRER